MSTIIRAQLDALRETYGSSYELLQRDLYRFLLSRLGGADQVAHELAAETLHRGWERLLSFRGSDLRPWLFRIAHNLAVDYLRSRPRQGRPLPEDILDREDEDPGEPAGPPRGELLDQFYQQLRSFRTVLDRLAAVLPEHEEHRGRPSRKDLLPRQVKLLRQSAELAWQFLEEERHNAQVENHP